jgi:hypothetical protein
MLLSSSASFVFRLHLILLKTFAKHIRLKSMAPRLLVEKPLTDRHLAMFARHFFNDVDVSLLLLWIDQMSVGQMVFDQMSWNLIEQQQKLRRKGDCNNRQFFRY